MLYLLTYFPFVVRFDAIISVNIFIAPYWNFIRCEYFEWQTNCYCGI